MTATEIRGLTSYAHGGCPIPPGRLASGLVGTGAASDTTTTPRAEPVPRGEHAPAVR